MPWTRTRVSLLMRILIPDGTSSSGERRGQNAERRVSSLGCQPHNLLRGFLWVDVGVNARRLEDAPPLFLIGAGETHHHADRMPRVHDAACDVITAGDAAKDVDEQLADAGLAHYDLDGLLHILRRRPAAHAEEGGGPAAEVRHHVQRGH